MSKNYFKKTLAGIFAVALVASAVPLAPFAPILDSISITASAASIEVDSWSTLQSAIENAENGIDTTITLAQNITATSADSCIIIPTGKVITLDLNGYTLDRGLSEQEAVDQGSVICVYGGSLTIKDSNTTQSGTITGGKTKYGGGIYINEGNVTIKGGNITKNTASIWGGGICIAEGNVTIKGGNITENTSKHGGGIYNKGTLTIIDGIISGNTAKSTETDKSYGGGIFACENKSLTVGGSAVIAGNKTTDSSDSIDESNIHSQNNKANINISTDTPLTKDAEIGITVYLSSGWDENTDISTYIDGMTAENAKQIFATNCGSANRGTVYYITAEDSKFVTTKEKPAASNKILNSELTWEIDENGVLTIMGDDEAFPAFSDEMGNWTHWCDAYSNVTSIVFETPYLTSIGSGAFADFTGLTSLELPDTVESIGKDAFNNCSRLASVELPAALLSLGQGAFFSCSALEEVVLPSAVTTIGQAAFGCCSKLISVTIPKSVKSIDVDLFFECQAMETVNYTGTADEWNAISIGSSNSVLNNIPITYNYRVRNTIPNSTLTYEIDDEGVLTIMGDDTAFPDCIDTELGMPLTWCDKLDDVKEVVFATPNLTSIGTAAFGGFDSLTSITLPETLTSIGDYAFAECSSLTSVTIPASVTSIGDYAFSSTSLTSITIPDSVTSIGAGAFYWCETLTSVTISDSVTSIGYATFDGTSLTSITIPDSVTSIGDYAFAQCSSLTSITIPDSVTSIGNNAFDLCSSLKNVHYTGSASDWNNISMESGNDSLTTATITCDKAAQKILDSELTWEIDENGVLTIMGDDEAFPECWVNNALVEWCDKKDDVKEVVFATPNLTSLGKDAFEGFDSMTSITIPDSVVTISAKAFYNCKQLTNIVFGKDSKLSSIGDNAFYKCECLKNIEFPASVTSIGQSSFYLCNSFTEIKIPASVKTISAAAFNNCSALENIEFAEGSELTSIEQGTFYNCKKLSSITIPASVTEIGQMAFQATSLSTITFAGNMPVIGLKAFDKVGTDTAPATLYYPNGNSSWEDFLKTQEETFELGNGYFKAQTIPTAKAKGYSVSYNGDVTINFHYLVSDSYKNGYVKFSDDTVVNVEDTVTDANGYCVFPISMPAKNMYDEITAQFYDANDVAVGDAVTFDLVTYMDKVKAYDPNYTNFVDSFLEYGAQAAAYFGVIGAPAGKTYSDSDFMDISNALEANYASTDNMGDTFVGATMLLKSTPKLRLYYSEDPGNYSTNEKNPDLFYTEKEISPVKFGTEDLNGYYVYNYIYKAMNSNDASLKPLCAAFYNMSKAIPTIG